MTKIVNLPEDLPSWDQISQRPKAQQRHPPPPQTYPPPTYRPTVYQHPSDERAEVIAEDTQPTGEKVSTWETYQTEDEYFIRPNTFAK